MFSLSFDILVLLYIVGGTGLILSLWLFYDYRDRARTRLRNQVVIFHCIKCGHIYTQKVGSEMAECPRCSFRNSRLRF